jgi:tRNA threonylcarbamoyl adenosine modification protein YjeE
VQPYETKTLALAHFDLYRVDDPKDVDELGLEDALSEGAVLIEWPERAAERMPHEALHIALRVTGEKARSAEISGPARWRGLMERA